MNINRRKELIRRFQVSRTCHEFETHHLSTIYHVVRTLSGDGVSSNFNFKNHEIIDWSEKSNESKCDKNKEKNAFPNLVALLGDFVGLDLAGRPPLD